MSQQALIVEDDQSLADMVQMVLEAEGWETTAVASGLDALPLVEALQPDVLVLDIMLPDRNGLEILLAMGELHPSVPIIVCSAYPMERATQQVEEMAHPPRIIQYLAKPYDIAALYAAVECAVQGTE